MIIPVILAGGSGTRLWPLSRQGYPKQFIDLVDADKSLFQQTVERILAIPACRSPIVVCSQDNRFKVAEQLKELDQQATVVLEPCGRNTAPAVALAAICAAEEQRDDPLLILPADHHLNADDAFCEAVEKATQLAESGYIVTFGVEPTAPETGYGYIKAGIPVASGLGTYLVDKFVEKPEKTLAQSYLEQDDYFWNSGMFVVRPKLYLQELKQHAADIYDQVVKAYELRKIDLDFVRIDAQAFAKVRSESIDYAVMEHTEQAAVVPLSGPWSDVGSWTAVSDAMSSDEDNNVQVGDVFLQDSSNCLVRAESRLVAAVGLKDTIVIETADAVLVVDKNASQAVKQVVERLKHENRPEASDHTKVYRPWGWYESICNSDRFQVKRIMVKPGHSLSLQMHHHRAEHWVVVKGTAEITRGEEKIMLTEDESTYIPLGTTHRLANPGVIGLEIIEVQTGSYLGEDDIVRFEDSYGRQ